MAHRTFESQKTKKINHFSLVKEPILGFIDELLSIISKSYWDETEKIKTTVNDDLKTLRSKESLIKARLKSLDNPNAITSFKTITNKYPEFKRKLNKEELEEARKCSKEIEDEVGNFINYLIPGK